MLAPADDPNHSSNSPRYHTGKECIEPDCHNPAGTAWSPFWCQKCNGERLRRISRNLKDIIEGFDK